VVVTESLSQFGSRLANERKPIGYLLWLFCVPAQCSRNGRGAHRAENVDRIHCNRQHVGVPGPSATPASYVTVDGPDSWARIRLPNAPLEMLTPPPTVSLAGDDPRRIEGYMLDGLSAGGKEDVDDAVGCFHGSGIAVFPVAVGKYSSIWPGLPVVGR